MKDNKNTQVQNFVDSISLGNPNSHGNLTVFPIHVENESIPFITLRDALNKDLIQIMEKSEGGSVPELRVISSSEIPILLLDGEEIAGAKQNRILNTSILVPEKGDIIIPVSCTEEGRWSYNSPKFYDSDEILSHTIRASKMDSVSANLNRGNSYASDQGAVWSGIQHIAMGENVSSHSGAMKDIYEAKRPELDNLNKNFPLQKNQKGLLVYINAYPVGFDLVATSEAYAQYHEKLLRSYAISLLRNVDYREGSDEQINGMSFINLAASCMETQFKSIGLGWDYRYERSGIIGSLLMVVNSMIHTAFFNTGNQHSYYRESGRIVRRRWYR